MQMKLQNIKTALTRDAPMGQKPRWQDLLGDFLSATSSPLTPEVERILLAILSSDGELQLNEESEMPHNMSPENMLKSLAVQALGRWTGATYLPTMQHVQATAPPSLACVVRGVIQNVTGQNGKAFSTDAVAEIRSGEPLNLAKLDGL